MNPLRQGAACALVLLLSACSSNSSAPTDPPKPDDITNVIYVDGVTDEALERMLDGTPKDDPRQAVVVDSPDLTSPLPRGSAATFTFHLASEATRTPSLRRGSAHEPPSKWQRAGHELLRFLSPEGTAHAHGEPYNGTAYYLVIRDAESKTRLQVFTPETSYTPQDADWQNLVQAPQPLKLEITSAFFEENDVPVDGGPFIGGTFPFTIE